MEFTATTTWNDLKAMSPGDLEDLLYDQLEGWTFDQFADWVFSLTEITDRENFSFDLEMQDINGFVGAVEGYLGE